MWGGKSVCRVLLSPTQPQGDMMLNPLSPPSTCTDLRATERHVADVSNNPTSDRMHACRPTSHPPGTHASQQDRR